jgi:CubicO group peptidase (beta-lactamase class C family)
MLIERVSGLPYRQFLQERIFDRLGMHDSGYDDGRKIVPRKARGYALSGKELQTPVSFDPRLAWSAGALYSTIQDLTRWSEAIAHGKLLNADSTRRAFQIYPEAVSQDNYHVPAHYGYGIVIGERFGRIVQYHAGGFPGFNSVLQRYPQSNLVVAVLSNLDSDSDVMPTWILGDELAKPWFAQQPK